MKFKSKGLLISIIILISMMLICHTVNFLYPRNKNSNSFSNLPLFIPNNTLPIEYNNIYYDYSNTDQKLNCKMKNEAEIPCKIITKCTIPIVTPTISALPTTTKYQLSESEIAMIYRDAYFDAGRELLLRTLNEE